MLLWNYTDAMDHLSTSEFQLQHKLPVTIKVPFLSMVEKNCGWTMVGRDAEVVSCFGIQHLG